MSEVKTLEMACRAISNRYFGRKGRPNDHDFRRVARTQTDADLLSTRRIGQACLKAFRNKFGPFQSPPDAMHADEV